MKTSEKSPLQKKPFSLKQKKVFNIKNAPYSDIDFNEVNSRAQILANIIEDRFNHLSDILLRYESYEVVKDEVVRTLDLLRNLNENKKYFHLRVGAVTSFLPRNQPLYAFACFVIVPSLMASEVHFRIPNSMRYFFLEVFELLDIPKLFPNIFISYEERLEFLIKRSALLVNVKTEETKPITDVVIFTGTSAHADQLRLVFDKRVLFISNGSGHNPVVVSKDADISKAVDAILTLQFYNQGQDCAAPNAILVHKNIFKYFLSVLRHFVSTTRVGFYEDKSCRVGPISDPKDLVRIQDFLINNREWIDPSTPGIIRTIDAIVEPTIICKPLIKGGNFNEIFAPIIFVQEYEDDSLLNNYFEDQNYTQNAMYVTLYGTSKYIKSLIDRPIKGKVLHKKSSFMHNTHLHALGIERGTQPYGGYGYGASSLSINGKITPLPTLPQRDIYERIAKPILTKKSIEKYRKELKSFTKIQNRDVKKMLRISSQKEEKQESSLNPKGITYLDVHLIKSRNVRYIKVNEENVYQLLTKTNIEYINNLKPADIKLISALKKLLKRKSKVSLDEFSLLLYRIPDELKEVGMSKVDKQRMFFKHIYHLLFGVNSGPRLAPFLFDTEEPIIDRLLDI